MKKKKIIDEKSLTNRVWNFSVAKQSLLKKIAEVKHISPFHFARQCAGQQHEIQRKNYSNIEMTR